MDQRSRRSSPNDASTPRQKKAEKHSPEASPSKKVQELRAHHRIAGGQHPREWQASAAEASTSGLEGKSAGQREDRPAEGKEVSVLSNARDQGKDVLTPEMEKFLKSIPIGEDGKRIPKVIELSTRSTLDNPILVGGMMRLVKGEMSQASDEERREQAHLHYDQACRHYEQKDHDKAKREYDQAKNLYVDVLADDKLQSTQDSLGMARAMANLADIYTMERNFDEARKWYECALPICERELGPDHGKTKEIRAKMFLGQQVGNYRLTQLLGYGGFGSVYLGEHIHLPNRRRAIKLLNQVHLVSQKDKDTFYKEAQILVDLKHKNIIRVKDFGLKNGIPYLEMQYAPNGILHDAYPLGTLSDPEQPLSPMEVLTLARPLAAALQYIHNMKIVHLDLKQANVFLGADGEILLGDFGLAQIFHRTASLRASELLPVAGTRPYVDPDYLQTGVPQPKNDQYAFGMMILQWFTGQQFPPTASSDIPGIPPEMRKVVGRMLELDPRKRYDHIKEAFEELEKAWHISKQKDKTIQEQMNNLRNEIKILKQDKKVLQEKIENIERDKQDLQERVKKLELEKKEQQDKVSNLEAVQHENQTLRRDKQRLEQALQEKQHHEKTLQEIVQLVNQSLQQKDHMASTSGTSSLEKGEANSSSTGREGTKSHTEQQRLDHSRNLRQQVDQQKQENENRDKIVQGPNSNVKETYQGKEDQKDIIAKVVEQIGKSDEKQEGQKKEQVAPTSRVPQGEGSNLRSAGGNGGTEVGKAKKQEVRKEEQVTPTGRVPKFGGWLDEDPYPHTIFFNPRSRR